MTQSHVKITQSLLDRFQPGKDAEAVLATWGLDLQSGTRPDIILLSDLLYDGLCQESLNDYVAERPRIEQPSFLLKELIYRYLKTILEEEGMQQSSLFFDQVRTYKLLASKAQADMRMIERDAGLKPLHKDGMQALEHQEELIKDVYVMGEAKRILRDMGGSKIRALYFKEEQKPNPKTNPFKLKKFEEIRTSMAADQASVDAMSDEELSARILKSFEGTSGATWDVEMPVYGVKTVFAYTPILLDRLMSGWSFDSQPVMDSLSTRMTEASKELRDIKIKLQRMESCYEY